MERIREPENLLKDIRNRVSLERPEVYDKDQNQEKRPFPEHSGDSDTQRRLHEIYGANMLGIIRINPPGPV